MFCVLLRAWGKQKILSPHEVSNLRTSDSALRCSTMSLETLSNSFSMVIVFIASSTLSRIIRIVFLLLISIYISHNVNESP